MKRLIWTVILGLAVLAAAGCNVVLGGGCEYEDEQYSLGDSFPSEDGCNTCSCELDGTVACTAMGCEQVCEYNGQEYEVGEKFEAGYDCGVDIYCTCEAGGTVLCPDLDCAWDCEYYGEYYAAGSSFTEIDSCNSCVCGDSGGVSCTEINCPLPAPNFEENQTVIFGCGDLWAYSTNEDDSISIGLGLEDLVYHASTQQAVVTREYRLPSDEVELSVLVGRNLSINYCNDVIMGQPTVVRTMNATAGDLTVTITRTGTQEPWESPTHADILLENVVFQDVDGPHTVTVDHFEMNEVHVGWFPG